jgi:hypothetical protein
MCAHVRGGQNSSSAFGSRHRYSAARVCRDFNNPHCYFGSRHMSADRESIGH